MYSSLPRPGRNPRVVPVLHTLTGMLLIGSNPVETPAGSNEIVEIAALVGGASLIVLGILGIWRPSQWGPNEEPQWLVASYSVAVMLLFATVLLKTV